MELKLKHGMAILPDDFVLADSSTLSEADYVGVVEVGNCDMPHYVVLSKKPISALSEEEEHRLIELCCQVSEELAEIRRKEVRPVFNEKGKMINSELWMTSPHIGLFSVPEVESEENLYLGTGIIRRREYE